MKKILPLYLLIISIFFILSQSVNAENIHFNNDIYHLNSSSISTTNNLTQNEYYKPKENKDFWTSMIEISYYPEISNPLKYAADIDKKISGKENFLLLKFVQNKKQDIAVISYLENVIQNENTFFIYNIYKYEKHPQKGMMVLRFAKKYAFSTKEEITKIGKEVKEINNDFMEQIIISPIPPIIKE